MTYVDFLKLVKSIIKWSTTATKSSETSENIRNDIPSETSKVTESNKVSKLDNKCKPLPEPSKKPYMPWAFNWDGYEWVPIFWENKHFKFYGRKILAIKNSDGSIRKWVK